MNIDNRRKILIVLGLYLLATFTLLFWGYSVREPVIASREFPFTITLGIASVLILLNFLFFGLGVFIFLDLLCHFGQSIHQ